MIICGEWGGGHLAMAVLSYPRCSHLLPVSFSSPVGPPALLPFYFQWYIFYFVFQRKKWVVSIPGPQTPHAGSPVPCAGKGVLCGAQRLSPSPTKSRVESGGGSPLWMRLSGLGSCVPCLPMSCFTRPVSWGSQAAQHSRNCVESKGGWALLSGNVG